MSDTPLTDKEIEAYDQGWARSPVSADFARTLERENANLREWINRYINASAVDKAVIEELQKVISEQDRLLDAYADEHTLSGLPAEDVQ